MFSMEQLLQLMLHKILVFQLTLYFYQTSFYLFSAIFTSNRNKGKAYGSGRCIGRDNLNCFLCRFQRVVGFCDNINATRSYNASFAVAMY